ncbi:MAG: heme o synthase [Bacteroidia bacterium]|nr:heme o synthase [Bacteroidia bacterium]
MKEHLTEPIEQKSAGAGALTDKVKALVELMKLRLSMLVAISAQFGYAVAAGTDTQWPQLLMVGFTALVLTGASNTLNQLFEKEYDAQMKRTAGRPMPTGRVTLAEGLIFAVALAVLAIVLLGVWFNLPAALLGIIALLSYAFVYTPMKRMSSFCVFIGAIPGGLPPLIGWVAFTGYIGLEGLILFAFQFLWQFPHFWSIAWLLDEDYQRAGFKMLPSASGKSRFTAGMILLYTLSLIPMALFPLMSGMSGWVATVVLGLLGVVFAIPAFRLYRSQEAKFARQVMFMSFFYLPLSQATLLIGWLAISSL